MATPILGPIQTDVRLQFTVTFTVPSNYNASADGNAEIIDTLPLAQLALYTGTGALNSVYVGGVDKTANATFSGSTTPSCVIASAALAAGAVVIVTFDTYITDGPAIIAAGKENTDITNSAAVSFQNAVTGKYAAANANITFQLSAENDLRRTAPLVFLNLFSPIEYNYEFTASTITSTEAAPFKYFITDTFGDNHDLQYTGDPAVPTVSASYVNDLGSTVTIDVTTEKSGKSYTFSFTHDTAFAGKTITLAYTATVSGLSLGLTLIDKLTYSIGGAIGKETEFDLTVSIG